MNYKLIYIVLLTILSTNLFANLNKVSLQLQWKHAFQFAGYYMAKEKGYYNEIGIDLEIKEFSYGLNITEDVQRGISTYAVGRPSIIIDKAMGKDIILLAAIFQSSPLIVLTTTQTGIKSIKDFKNKKIMTVNDSSNDAAINAMLKSQNLNLKDMKIIKHSFDIQDLINGKTDLLTAYISDQPNKLIKLGYKPVIFHPADYGFDFYSDILFTSNKEVKNNPKRVSNFKNMSLKGWEYAFDNIEETIEVILKKYNTQNLSRDTLFYEARELKKLAYYNTNEIGKIKKEKVIKIIGMYNLIKNIKSNINLENLIYKNNYSKNDILSNKEKEYLSIKKHITMCIDPNWMPFEQFDTKGNHVGMTKEYFEVFQKYIKIPINIIKTKSWSQSIEFAKSKKCDILSLAMPTKERQKYMNFTIPYFDTPLVLATKPNVQFIDDLANLKDKKIGITKGYAFSNILRRDYPKIKIIDLINMEDGLQQVVNGELYGFIDTLATIAYMFQTKFTGELKISGKFNNKWELGVAVRNDDLILLNIFNKIIKNFSPDLKQNILNKYVGIKYEQGFDYSFIWKIIVLFSIFCIFIIYRFNIIRNYNKKIEEYLSVINNHILVSTSDMNGIITEVSDALCNLTGYKKEELIGKNHNIFRHEDMQEEAFEDLWKTILKGESWKGEVKNRNKDGSYYWADVIISPIYDKKHQIKGFNAIRNDITDKKKLEVLSYTDALTKIPNRLYLDKNYEREIKRVNRYKNELSIILIDIDYFKRINDSYGHEVGDKVLIQIATILSEHIRTTDFIGRWGGEEFLIICPETNIENAKVLAENTRKRIEEYNFSINETITCSFGVAKYFNNQKDDTFNRADKALYKAKEKGRNMVVVH